MATDKNAAPSPAPRFTTGIESDMTVSADIGIAGALEDSKSRITNNDAVSTLVSGKEKVKDAIKEAELEGEELLKEGEEKLKEGEENIEALVDEELGEWKVGDADLQAKYDARYFDKEGQLNQDALAKEFWKNSGAGKSQLNDATYAYLKDTLGVSKEFAQSVERALVAENTIAATQFYEKVGGKENFELAVAWGREGGYTPAQRERFNKLREAGGADFEDAVEALMARYQKANPSAAAPAGRRGPPKAAEGERRRSAPERSTNTGAGNAGPGVGDRFASEADYQNAWQSGLQAQKKALTAADKRTARDNLDALRKKARRGFAS